MMVFLASCRDATAVAPAISVGNVSVDPQWDELLRPQQRGFLGADGAASVPLGDGRVLWIFGDTILGSIKDGKRQGPMVRNSIAIQSPGPAGSPGTAEFFWDFTDRIPGDFFHSDSFADAHWYWPGTGILHDGKVWAFLTKLDQGEGPEGFAFRTIDCTLFCIDNPADHPDDWRMKHWDLGLGDQHFNINAASIIEGGFVYLLGYDDPNDVSMNRQQILARMPLGALGSDDPRASIQFLAKTGEWSPEPANFKYLFEPGTTETAIYRDQQRGLYVTFLIRPFDSDLLMYTAPALVGPWSEPVKIYDIPEVTDGQIQHAYTARVHPELEAGKDAVYLTYVVNTTDFWGMFSRMDIYYPRFLRIEFE